MAMLLMNSIFERTWGSRAGPRPATEYWVEVISAIKRHHSDFLFIAEAYWDLEWELQQQGFDFCYDKRLYDRLEHENAESVRLHLCADPAYQNKLLRFIENHDEPRAASAFTPAKERAAAVTTVDFARRQTLPRRPIRGPQGEAASLPGQTSRGAARRGTQNFYTKLLLPSTARYSETETGTCVNAPAGRITRASKI